MVSKEIPVPTLVVASGNQHKVSEIEVALRQTHRFKAVVGVRKFSDSLPDIEETGTSFMENAIIKAMGWARWLKDQGLANDDWVLADDSGICIDALDGKPGIYSARFAGNQASDKMNNDLVVSEMQRRNLEWSEAHYVCAIVVVRVDLSTMHFGERSSYKAGQEIDFNAVFGTVPTKPQSRGEIWKDPRMLQVSGRCDGEISVHFRGSGGFGYDPHFWIDRRSQTFAELDPGEKAKRSHRGEALRNLAQCLSLTNFG